MTGWSTSCAGKVSLTRSRAIGRADELAPPGDGRHDRDLVALLERGLVAVEEADVLLVHVDVDEAADLPALLDDALAEPGKLAVELVDHGAHRRRLGLHLGGALGHRPERCGNPDEYGHRSLLSGCRVTAT